MDLHVLMHRQRQMRIDETEETLYATSETASSVFTDQWIDQRISTCVDVQQTSAPKKKRSHDRLLKNYRNNESVENLTNQSTLITKNNLYCTIIDVTKAASFEILYPLIYDSNALFIIPVNLTSLLNAIQTATALDKMNEFDAFFLLFQQKIFEFLFVLETQISFQSSITMLYSRKIGFSLKSFVTLNRFLIIVMKHRSRSSV